MPGIPPLPIAVKYQYLAGNPVKVKFFAGASASSRYRVYKYDGSAYSELIYEGVVFTTTTYAEVDLASLFADLTSVAGVTKCMVGLVDSVGVLGFTAEFEVYGGGISKQLLRRYADSGTDVFAEKLKNATKNFFLTTRSAGTIIIAENELLPLYFYAKGLVFSIQTGGVTIGTYNFTDMPADGLDSIDFNDLRGNVLMTENKLVSVFDIYSGAVLRFSVLIADAKWTPYYLKFKNSWGVYELFALDTEIDYVPVVEEAKQVSKYDVLIDDFSTHTMRKVIGGSYEISTVYKSALDLHFMLDMLHSDDVILVANGNEYAVNVSSSNSKLDGTSGEPIAWILKLELKDAESMYSPLN